MTDKNDMGLDEPLARPRAQDEPQMPLEALIPFVTAKLLRTMQVGESRVVQEKVKQNGGMGTYAQGYAKNAKIRIKTQSCHLVSTKRLEVIRVLVVTRVE